MLIYIIEMIFGENKIDGSFVQLKRNFLMYKIPMKIYIYLFIHLHDLCSSTFWTCAGNLQNSYKMSYRYGSLSTLYYPINTCDNMKAMYNNSSEKITC